MKILLDTNFLLVPIQFRVDVYDYPAEFYTTSRCIEELEILSRRRGKAGIEARAAAILLKTKSVKIARLEGKTDDSLVRLAKKEGFAVATNDKDLIAKLKKEGVKIVRLRQKKIVAEE